MLVGYARCSTEEQDPLSQARKLNENETPGAQLEERERRIAAPIACSAKDALVRFTSIPERIRQHVRKFRPDWYFVIRRHWHVHGRLPRLFRPRTFNDKVLHRI